MPGAVGAVIGARHYKIWHYKIFMTTMDQIHHIRQLYYEQGKNISEIAAITGLNWKTVAKIVDMTDFNPPAPKPVTMLQSCPKNAFKPLFDQWLTEDKKAPRKQRQSNNT